MYIHSDLTKNPLLSSVLNRLSIHLYTSDIKISPGKNRLLYTNQYIDIHQILTLL